MLVLARKTGETIMIGDYIQIIFLSAKGNQIRLGFDAPSHVTIHRKEIYEKIKAEQPWDAKAKSQTKIIVKKSIYECVGQGTSVHQSRN